MSIIDPTAIQELVDKEPFQSFRIRMSDGNHYDVVNPELVVPMEDMLFIALPKRRWKFLSYQNMTSVESSEVEA